MVTIARAAKAILCAVLLSAPLLPAAATGPPTARVIVGFDTLPAGLEDGRWRGWDVVDVRERLDLALLSVDDPGAVRRALADDPAVAFVERDAPDAVVPLAVPDDPRFDDQYAPQQTDTPGAWDETLGDPGVTVAILDTGIRNDHEDLEGAIVAEHDYVDDDGDAEPCNGHATTIAGVAAARTDNGAGIAGTAQVGLMDFRVFDDDATGGGCGSTIWNLTSAIDDAVAEGADVISFSLALSLGESESVDRAITRAWDDGVLIVGAAGNGEGNSGTGTDCPDDDCVEWPAADPLVVAVTGTQEGESAWTGSARGPEAEVAAPADDVLSTCADHDAHYCRKDGTSFAAPRVAAVASLMISANPDLTPPVIRDVLNATAQDLGDDGHDATFGHGEVDAAAAVQEALNIDPTARFQAACTGRDCSFDASASSDLEGPVASYTWDLGDGTEASGAVVDHVYAEAGTYDVNLTVTDADGATDTAAQTIRVFADGVLLDEDFDDGIGEAWTLEEMWHVDDRCADPPSGASYLGYHREDECSYVDLDPGVDADPPSVHVDPHGDNPVYVDDGDVQIEEGFRAMGRARVDVDLTSVDGATLTFAHRWQREPTCLEVRDGTPPDTGACLFPDTMELFVKPADGSWSRLKRWHGSEQLDWRTESFDLADYGGQRIRLAFEFDSNSADQNDYLGWHVDDVRVEAS